VRIRAAIFDIGGVLVSSPVMSIRNFERKAGLPDGALRPLFASHEGAWSRFERSELTPKEFVPVFEAECAELGFTVDGTHFLESFFTALAVREEMVGVVRALRGRLRLGCITNNVSRGEDPHEGPLVLGDLFDVVVESSKVGLRKPNPRIYEMCCDELGVPAEQCVFLDDFGVNLKAARALGMTTIKVDETTSAIDELESALGFDLPRHVARA